MMCERANARVITPDGDTLADRQVIQHWVAELDAEIRGARLQTLHAAWMIDRHGASAARDEISAIKFSVADTMLHAIDKAIQVHGALGVTDDTVLSHWYRHERAARIYDGADEVHKTTLGRRILRRYASAAPMLPSPRGSAQLVGDGCRAVIGDGEGGERAPGEPCRSLVAEDERRCGVAIGKREVLGHDGHRHETPRGLARARIDDVVAPLVSPRRGHADVADLEHHGDLVSLPWVADAARATARRVAGAPAVTTSPPALIAKLAAPARRRSSAAR